VSGARCAATGARLLETPLGPIELRASRGALCGLYLPSRRHPPPPLAPGAWAPTGDDRLVLDEAARQLGAYFRGALTRFELPLVTAGTPFQEGVWRRLRDIPFAETWSYGALARALARPAASRAVGAANGRNPISIIVPCHRVIGSDGGLTGYGGGEPAKRWLLDHELRTAAAASAGGSRTSPAAAPGSRRPARWGSRESRRPG
jgi:methylated-DNA-[protein]-cysteine S-methyltransferase